jgi:hypothetical protein
MDSLIVNYISDEENKDDTITLKYLDKKITKKYKEIKKLIELYELSSSLTSKKRKIDSFEELEEVSEEKIKKIKKNIEIYSNKDSEFRKDVKPKKIVYTSSIIDPHNEKSINEKSINEKSMNISNISDEKQIESEKNAISKLINKGLSEIKSSVSELDKELNSDFYNSNRICNRALTYCKHYKSNKGCTFAHTPEQLLCKNGKYCEIKCNSLLHTNEDLYILEQLLISGRKTFALCEQYYHCGECYDPYCKCIHYNSRKYSYHYDIRRC